MSASDAATCRIIPDPVCTLRKRAWLARWKIRLSSQQACVRCRASQPWCDRANSMLSATLRLSYEPLRTTYTQHWRRPIDLYKTRCSLRPVFCKVLLPWLIMRPRRWKMSDSLADGVSQACGVQTVTMDMQLFNMLEFCQLTFTSLCHLCHYVLHLQCNS